VGNDPASKVYVGRKEKTSKKLGMDSETIYLPEETTEQELLDLISRLNDDPQVHGILVQLPLPQHIDEQKVILHIHPDKDVDCFHPRNVGLLVSGDPYVLPCTPAGIVEILKYYKIEVQSKHAVVIGRSNIVGKPMANLLLQKNEHANATVTVVHSRTKDLAEHTRRADILIAAMGRPRFVTADMIKEGAVVIDVGINRVAADNEKGYALVGDVDYERALPRVAAITPVPGGVGPMTIAMLMRNTLNVAARQNGIDLS
jgi:methylenetetrahydrofolate dehydrogenase (NADP+)/methenyltetrahydrofolate cyclohydrolase